MEIRLESQPYFAVQTDALVTYVFDKDDKFDGVLGEIDRALNGQLASLASSGEMTGKSLELTLLHFPQGLTAKKLLLVGAGKPEKFAVSDLRNIAGTAGLVFRDVKVYQPGLSGANLGISFAKGSFPFAEGFHLGADQNQTGFELIEQIVVIGGRPILGDNLKALSALLFRRGFHCFAMIAGGRRHPQVVLSGGFPRCC